MPQAEVPNLVAVVAPITSIFAILFTGFYIFLAARVIRFRRRDLISLGDGGKEEVSRAIRAHANFAEYVPLALILMGLFEFQGGSPWHVGFMGGLLLIGRALHARGLTVVKDRKLPFRFWGMVLTFASLVGLALRLLVQQVIGH